MNFSNYPFKEFIISAINDLKFKELTPIQKELLNIENKNVIASSKTGSGKTHAFLFPIFNHLDLDLPKVQAVIVAPTKDLVLQIKKMADHIIKFSDQPIDVRAYYGGTDRNREIDKLKNSQPQIVIGTPGKIKDLAFDHAHLLIYTANLLVIDEVDMAFDIGFIHEIEDITKRLINAKIYLFSATINEKVEVFLKKYLKEYKLINLTNYSDQLLNINHYFIPAKAKDKFFLLKSLTKVINPYLAIIFANTKKKAMEISQYLHENKIDNVLFHGGIPMRERKRIIQEINHLKYQYIVASDIASRGIDIEGISHIINFELPNDVEFYIHRSGRTGRAGLEGECISLYDFEDDKYLDLLEKKGIKGKYKEIKNNELIDYRGRNIRKERKIGESKEIIKAKNMMKAPTKVKPGYKKKYREKTIKLAKEIKKGRYQ